MKPPISPTTALRSVSTIETVVPPTFGTYPRRSECGGTQAGAAPAVVPASARPASNARPNRRVTTEWGICIDPTVRVGSVAWRAGSAGSRVDEFVYAYSEE